MVTTCSPRPMRAVQRAMLWAITCTARGGVGGEAARGEMVQPHTVLEVAYRILDLGVAGWSASSSSISPSRSVMKP